MDSRKLADFCIDSFDTIFPSRRVKFKCNEWTTFSAIVLFDRSKERDPYTIVSAAIGTKCVGCNRYTSKGNVIHDSHSEVLARRSFLRYIYQQVKLAIANEKPSIFQYLTEKSEYRLKDQYSFHMFITHSPCGDASIYPLAKQETGSSVYLNNPFDDINRTGAKYVPHPSQEPDKFLPGPLFHQVGLLRLKPGRGPRSLSMSCSDKIMRWNILGLQGGLLFSILKFPIFLSSITICGENHDMDSLRRAILDRCKTQYGIPNKWSLSSLFSSPKICLYEEKQIKFKYEKSGSITMVPSTNNVVYCRDPFIYESIVDGHLRGTTKKCRDRKFSNISKASLFREYKNIMGNETNDYQEAKHSTSISYAEARKNFMESVKAWIVKDDVDNFDLKAVNNS